MKNMANVFDLSKGYLPIVLVVGMLISCMSASYWLATMSNTVENNTAKISKIDDKLEVLPDITTDITLIKYRLGIDDKDDEPSPTAMAPYRISLD